MEAPEMAGDGAGMADGGATARTTKSHRESHGRVAYDVNLEKGVCGLGIYFTAAADGAAIVDPLKPFYRLPDDTEAPGEASGAIAPGDRLLVINGTSVANWRLSDVVEELRRVPLGDVELRLEREVTEPDDVACTQHTEAASLEAGSRLKRVRWTLFDWQVPATTAHEESMKRVAAMEELLLDMESKIRSLEEEVEREKKCRFLAEKKNILYRNALRSLSGENSQLRFELEMRKQAETEREQFTKQHLHLSI